MKRTLVVDNYDSFTYNLVHLLRECGANVDVQRNNELCNVDAYDRIVLSPGPGIPSEAGELIPLIREYASCKTILGVCLGHQAIGEVFGARLTRAHAICHGTASPIHVLDEADPLFRGVSRTFSAGRYHSWAVDSLPDSLIATAVDDQGTVMALRHVDLPVFGVQFHPESILTPAGREILSNWMEV